MAAGAPMPAPRGPRAAGGARGLLSGRSIARSCSRPCRPPRAGGRGEGPTGGGGARGARFVDPLTSPPQRAALGLHGAALVREVWCHFTSPGTFHRVRSALLSFAAHPTLGFRLAPAPSADGGSSHGGAATATDEWYVGDADLARFRQAVEVPAEAGGPDWGAPLFERDYGGVIYTAWRRFLPCGKTEYKSTTVALDATAEEFSDFYLDDRTRPTWDTMIAEHAALEVGDPASRCMVVRWRRSFPFAFLTDREYVIARRVWRVGGDDGTPNAGLGPVLYTVTKAVPGHPAAPPARGVVQMDVFFSAWRSRTVPCPRGSGAPACETTLLHREDFKIPERLARVAVRAGMAGFVRGMVPAVRSFVDARRRRVPPHAVDPAAYGVGCAAATAAAAARGGVPPARLAPSGRPLPPARSCPQLAGGGYGGRGKLRVTMAEPEAAEVGADARAAAEPAEVLPPAEAGARHHHRRHHHHHHPSSPAARLGAAVAVAAAVALAGAVVGAGAERRRARNRDRARTATAARAHAARASSVDA